MSRGDAAGEKAFTGHKIQTVCMELMDRPLQVSVLGCFWPWGSVDGFDGRQIGPDTFKDILNVKTHIRG